VKVIIEIETDTKWVFANENIKMGQLVDAINKDNQDWKELFGLSESTTLTARVEL
jgi:hypothetical protein